MKILQIGGPQNDEDQYYIAEIQDDGDYGDFYKALLVWFELQTESEVEEDKERNVEDKENTDEVNEEEAFQT